MTSTGPATGRHLRLYVRLPASDRYGQAAAARVAEWATGLRGQGLVPDIELDTYHPETGRYGHGAAMVNVIRFPRRARRPWHRPRHQRAFRPAHPSPAPRRRRGRAPKK
ncbi:lantibiotic dehydratase C-terminal domain-containing protein [Streptosporangium sp. LJ11]|uniref:lantibiotic dehydratase C-terminal domain-containing protein n=1 Tax=Streptosporangium sp. LJ11 TaxID=3436927 RepID=UPI003F797091